MQLISFVRDLALTLFNKPFKVVGIKQPDIVELEGADGETREYELDNLSAQYGLRNLRFPKPPPRNKKPDTAPPAKIAMRLSSELSDSARADGLQKKLYLDAIIRSGVSMTRMTPSLERVISQVTAECDREKNPSLSTLRRWLNQRLRGGDDTALMPYYARRGGGGKSRLPAPTQQEIHRVVDNLYLSPARPSAKTCFDACIANIAEKNQWLPSSQQIDTPSYRSFLRFLQRREGYEVLASRWGRREAELRYRSSGKATEQYSLNECWEMDHTILDLFAINPQTQKPERPRITVALEYVSRIPMGFDIDFSGTSAQASLDCIRHAILPKTYLEERYPGIQGRWPCYGAPRIIKVDNGMEFHSKSFKHACLDLSIQIQYCATASPWQKGRIERFFRTLNESLVGLPGYSGSHLYQDRSDKKPERAAVLTLPQLMEQLHMWIVDEYLPKNHKGEE